MKSAPLDYRFRYFIHGLLYFCGFAFYWFPNAHESTWLVLTPQVERIGLSFTDATIALLVIAIVLAGIGAILRTWGAAYLGANIVEARDMHGNTVLADGPFRRSRNPLYLGTFLHTFALALIMSPYGALFTLITIGLFQIRLIFTEEPFLAARLGQPYLDYCKRVPRILPSLMPRVPPSGAQPHWLQAVLGEIYMIGIPVAFAIFGWRYNAFLLTKCVIICFGVSIVTRALIRKPSQAT